MGGVGDEALLHVDASFRTVEHVVEGFNQGSSSSGTRRADGRKVGGSAGFDGLAQAVEGPQAGKGQTRRA